MMASVDAGRKRVLLIAAAILAARKLCEFNPDAGRVPPTMTAIADAVEWANRIMQEIERRWPGERASLR